MLKPEEARDKSILLTYGKLRTELSLYLYDFVRIKFLTKSQISENSICGLMRISILIIVDIVHEYSCKE